MAHPENTNIVGLVLGNAVCFNNDGAVAGSGECDVSSVDEGFVTTDGNWKGGVFSGINGCGASAVNPVSSATCPFTQTYFYPCTNDEYVLVQTTKSSHFWAVKANADCTGVATPETTGLVPCRLTDAFDAVTGCVGRTTNQTGISVKGSYIQLETTTAPPTEHCVDITHHGRMVVDSEYDLLYICTQSGWTTTSLTPVP